MLEKINESVQFLREQFGGKPANGIILGTGLGALVDDILIEKVVPYDDIPHFPVSTVESHHGRLIFGSLMGKSVVVMQGRFHYYEGYSLKEVTFPVRVMAILGIKRLFISNAAGGLNPDYEISDLMIINDHIDLFPDNPLRGENINELGPRFVDLSEPYNFEMIDMAMALSKKENIPAHQGVYAAVSGPNLETRAEYKYIRTIGADAVGMSTIPENIVANHMGIPCFALSVITDLCVPGKIEKVSVDKIIAAANKAEPGMTTIIKGLLDQMP